MSHQVLARKWRPSRFENLVGQPHVVRALVNALSSGRIHHAYLFSGTRGVGKTTIARILARCLNCETGVTATPCGQCRPCVEIAEGRHLDLIEVDAASRTRVDDTRELLDNVSYAPVSGRYKVYLVDEVHMLSEKSFNALLKTLEEPPPHVIFLLATTDPQKLPVTVLSRCLQFNLKPMPAALIAEHLERVLASEGVAAAPGALLRLAEAAEGSMRDALSLTDQAIAYSGDELGESEVCDMIGLLPRSRLTELLDVVWAVQGARMLGLLRELDALAPDWARLLEELAALVHGVAVQQVLLQEPGAAAAGTPDDPASRWAQQAAAREAPEDIQLAYQILLHGARDLPYAPDARIGAEMTLLRMLAFRPAPDVQGGDSQVGDSAGNSGTRRAGRAAPAFGAAPERGAARAATGTPARSPTPVTPVAGAPGAPPRAGGSESGVRERVARETAAAPASKAGNSHAITQQGPAPEAQRTAPDPGSSVAAGLDWHAFAGSLPAGPARELALHADLLECGSERVVIAVQPAHRMLGTARTRARVAEALGRVLGYQVSLELREQAAPSGSTPAARLAADAADRHARAEAELRADPVIQTLQETFGAEVTRVVVAEEEDRPDAGAPPAS
ncbi:DNA polymerase III subunits gamma and tau [Thioalkalivibrio nitratireducens DSM 14787]|uniref:DNA polymerase III subunit gamma/tau n=1 Tax=Thioalkalivibrio nitratireducens (strain DSM 14787 / UNIQEM 213 / ALEN2) TaxID=1255043 RepID=L0DSB1_THIND|nr:DNA polymerase III subunit gamma/tau [Thioalkalivibrio nitratireducens]AGA32499.1 DNA polymerase III subunits gamma and tau [Thioalkalivibrio nitratireducens DSM 14787]